MTMATWIIQASECSIPWSVWAPIVGSGAFALAGVVVGAWIIDSNNRKAEVRSRTNKTQILAASIAAEISGLFRRYEAAIGDKLDKAVRPEDFKFGLVQPRFNFFVVFDANAANGKRRNFAADFYGSFFNSLLQIIYVPPDADHEIKLSARNLRHFFFRNELIDTRFGQAAEFGKRFRADNLRMFCDCRDVLFR